MLRRVVQAIPSHGTAGETLTAQERSQDYKFTKTDPRPKSGERQLVTLHIRLLANINHKTGNVRVRVAYARPSHETAGETITAQERSPDYKFTKTDSRPKSGERIVSYTTHTPLVIFHFIFVTSTKFNTVQFSFYLQCVVKTQELNL